MKHRNVPAAAGERTASAVAELAARLLARNEATDLSSARRKAAAQLGVHLAGREPDDAAIRAALNAYLQLFGGAAEAQRRRQHAQAAADALDFFARFQAELTEDSLGVAVEGAALELLVYCEPPETLQAFLGERGIDADLSSLALYPLDGKQGRIEFPAFDFLADDRPVRVACLPLQARRWALARSPRGEPLKRIRRLEGA